MSPEDLTAAECAVYAAAFGAEFSRALAFHDALNTTSLVAGGWSQGETTFSKHAGELLAAKEAAYYVAEQAVIAFRDTCGCELSEPHMVFGDVEPLTGDL